MESGRAAEDGNFTLNFGQLGAGRIFLSGFQKPWYHHVFLGGLSLAVWIRREIVVDGTHCRLLAMQCVSFGTYDRLETKKEK